MAGCHGLQAVEEVTRRDRGGTRVKPRGEHDAGMDLPRGLDHPAWSTGVGVVVGYGLILLAMFLVLFLFPYLAFSWL